MPLALFSKDSKFLWVTDCSFWRLEVLRESVHKGVQRKGGKGSEKSNVTF